jgi:hypothetical protein
VKSRVVLSALIVAGSFALSAPAAHAGSGGTPFPLTSFFVCHGIKGNTPGTVVDVDSSVLGTNPQEVKIGSGVLACVVAKLFPGGSEHNADPVVGNEINPNLETDSNGLKCYSVSVSRQPNTSPPNRYTVIDNLFGEDPDVQANQFQYICAPATFTNPH